MISSNLKKGMLFFALLNNLKKNRYLSKWRGLDKKTMKEDIYSTNELFVKPNLFIFLCRCVQLFIERYEIDSKKLRNSVKSYSHPNKRRK